MTRKRCWPTSTAAARLEKLPDLTPLYTSIYDTIPANIKLVIEYAYQLWIEVKSGNTWEQLKSKTWHDVLYGL